MAQQLIFTSAVAGLNPGSSGYCTVARSEAMRDAVVARLEQWSVYTHNANGQNPVVCAYRVLNLRGSVFHVLTRIVDSGLDYTGRTNFLAHHLVFQPHEIYNGVCSPAEVFLRWPGWVNQWEGGPHYLEDDGLALHTIPRSTKMPAGTWKEWAGDAGAATLLVAESNGGGARSRPADLVVPKGSDAVLPHLYAESLHLLDPKGENASATWAVPFTTFLQSQDDLGDFRWRGLSPENRLRTGSETTVDFGSRVFPPITSGLLTEYARTSNSKAVFLLGIRADQFAAVSAGKQISQPETSIKPRFTTKTPAKTKHPQPKADPVRAIKLPLWVLIGVLCAVPLGLFIGWWIRRPNQVYGPVTASVTPTLGVPLESPIPPEEKGVPGGNTPIPEAQPSPTVDVNLSRRKDRLGELIATLGKD